MKVHLSHPTRDLIIQGPKRVADIFKELNLIPEAFLIIRGQDLMTKTKPWRMVIALKSARSYQEGKLMRCRKCPKQAVLGLQRHNTAFCGECLTGFVEPRCNEPLRLNRCFPEDRILVAVSGGKTALTLWEILLKLGYRADALYV